MEVDARVIRRGAWTLPAAGLLLGAPWIKPYFAGSVGLSGMAGPQADPNLIDNKTWASIATSDGYALFSATQALGLLSLLFGMFVLYGFLVGGRSPHLALRALILGVAGIVPALMMLGVLAFAEPVLASLYQKGVDVCSTAAFSDLLPTALCRWWWGSLPSFVLALALYLLEFFIMVNLGDAIWRSGRVPRWVALAFPFAYFGCIAITPVMTLIGGFLMVVAGGRIALQLNRGAADRTSSHDALPAALRT
jgi:hypothetical protein